MASHQPRRHRGASEQGQDHGKRRGLSQAWRKRARPLKKTFGAAALCVMVGLGGCATLQAETRDVRPAATAKAKSGKPQKQKYEFSQERLDKIETRMKETELGRQLLQFAADQNISISMSDSKTMDPNPKDTSFIKGRNYGTYILINGETRSDDEIMITIAHELRHSWHERVIGSSDMAVTPRQHWLMRRIQEADAFSFEVHFGYEYEKATGRTLDLGDRQGACLGKTPFVCLAEQYRIDRDGNKPVAEAYSRLLERAMLHVHAMRYDPTFVGELDGGWSAVIQNPALGGNYADRFDHAATDAAFVAKMRAVATAGLVPGKDPAALTKWVDADFLSFEKTGGKEKGDQKKLAQVELKFTQAKDAWDKYDAARKPPPPAPPGPGA